MLGAALDCQRSLPFAFAEIGTGEQFAERENAGERGADVMRIGRKRAAGLSRTAFWPATNSLRFAARLFGPHSHHRPLHPPIWNRIVSENRPRSGFQCGELGGSG